MAEKTGLSGQTAYEMYVTIRDKEGEEAAEIWADQNLTDGEILAMQTYQIAQEKKSRRNWHEEFVRM